MGRWYEYGLRSIKRVFSACQIDMNIEFSRLRVFSVCQIDTNIGLTRLKNNFTRVKFFETVFTILKILKQGCTNFPKIYEPYQNYRLQKGDVNEVYAEDPKIFSANVQNALGFVHSCTSIF
jgi:hypothetical protein